MKDLYFTENNWAQIRLVFHFLESKTAEDVGSTVLFLISFTQFSKQPN